MKRILSRTNVEVLAQFAWSRVLLAFDFDGTLSPIVADREKATMRKRTAALLARINELYPTAVISGRSRADVAARLHGVTIAHIVGNHGAETGARRGAYADDVASARAALEAALAAWPGVDIEDKGASLAVHYRRARRRRASRDAVHAAVAALPKMRASDGKAVVNVVPKGAPHKGDALRTLRAELRCDTAVFVGDDVTDEDVFALDEPGRLLSIRVGRSRSSHAPWYLRDQAEIDALLKTLVELRAKGARS